MCRRKRQEKSEELMRVAKKAKTQKEVWKVINRVRGRKVAVNNEIEKEELDEYFKGILGGEEG